MDKCKNPNDDKAKAESITDAEWQVAKILWKKSPQTAAEIIDTLKDRTAWNPKTIHTLIGRLVKKKIIAAQPGMSPYSYYPLMTESDCEHEKTRSFIDRIYDGSFSLMVAKFVKDEKLSPEEIEELKDILNQR
jgi:BlaI family penicillinase repressor